MSIALVGELALWVALLLAAWGTLVSTLAAQTGRADLAQSGSRATLACTLFVLVAVLALWTALMRSDLEMAYVVAHGGLAATPAERVLALWAGPEGALLLVALAIGSASSAAIAMLIRAGDRALAASKRVLLAPGAAIANLALLGILLTVLAAPSPFAASGLPVVDGQGLAPVSRHVAMLVLWPGWSLAVAAAGAACMLAVAAALGRPPRTFRVHHAAEDWARAAWVLLTATLLIATWWAYRTAPGDRAWLPRALLPGAIVAWLVLAVLFFPILAYRLRAARARLVLLAAPLPMLLAAPLVAAEGTWDPLHELGHRASGAWWIVAIAALLMALAFVLLRTHHGTPPPPAGWNTAPDPLRDLGRRLMAVGAVMLVGALIAGTLRRDSRLALTPGTPETAVDRLGRQWRVVYQGPSVREGRHVSGAPRYSEVLHPIAIGRGDRESIVVSRVRAHVDAIGRPTAPPWPYRGIRHGALQDVIAVPDSLSDADTLHVRIAFVPLASLFWLGGVTLLAGGAMAGHALRVRQA